MLGDGVSRQNGGGVGTDHGQVYGEEEGTGDVFGYGTLVSKR